MAKTIDTKIDKLVPDNLNANKHSEYGMHLLEKSISTLGLGRSILVDKNNRIIGGNGVLETVGNLGMEDCIIVPTDGKKLVVVRRDDIDLDSKVGRELALADNAVAHANLKWDEANIAQIADSWQIDQEAWGIPEFDLPPDEEGKEDKKIISTKLIIECGDVVKLSALYTELQDRGFKCELKE